MELILTLDCKEHFISTMFIFMPPLDIIKTVLMNFYVLFVPSDLDLFSTNNLRFITTPVGLMAFLSHEKSTPCIF